jgi:hypothetical protein
MNMFLYIANNGYDLDPYVYLSFYHGKLLTAWRARDNFKADFHCSRFARAGGANITQLSL